MLTRVVGNAAEAMQFLLEFADYEKITSYKYDLQTFDLERVERLMRAVGDPHRAFRSVHIAGTKGKGSTAAMLQAILTEAGLKTGCFTSPHLVRLEERMTIDGEMMPEEELVALVNELLPYTVAARERSVWESPTFFELVTALGFRHFAKERVEAAVIEVGMGGRLDATNVITPEVSVITRIDFDHENRLGRTLAKIAFEKGGIIKRGVPVVVAEQAPEALGVLAALAHERHAPMVRVGRDVRVDGVSTGVGADGPYCRCTVATRSATYEAEMRLIGVHQAMNAAVAVAAAEIFANRIGGDLPEKAVLRGLAAARCPARAEYFAGRPPIILDGAHNPVSMAALRQVLDTVFRDRRTTLVIGIARDKNVDRILEIILPRAQKVFFTRSDSPRAESPDILLARANAICPLPAEAVEDAFEALARARAATGEDDLICITGSLYLAGKLRPALVEAR